MRRDDQRLQDILEALDSVAKMIAGRTEREFLDDEVLRYAVAQRLTVVGEAAGRLSPEISERNPSIPWADIVGFRNILVHQYFGIYWPLVWQTAKDHAPALRAQIAEILRTRLPE
jgi:uncharacterized protein with HEPN domain